MILEEHLPPEKQTPESSGIFLHLGYNSRSGVKPDHSQSGGLSVTANDMAVFLGKNMLRNVCKSWQML